MCIVFFFKQKTAYEMRISDWSSDVCSSDLGAVGLQYLANGGGRSQARQGGQVATRFGVTGTHEHAAGHGLHREDMTGLDQVGRQGIARHRRLYGDRKSVA